MLFSPPDHASCLDPLLCCVTQAVLSAWFGVVVLVPFSLSPLYRIPHVTTAPFSTFLFTLALPEPCTCVHSIHFVSACLYHIRSVPRPGLCTLTDKGQALLPLCSLSLADGVQNFVIMVLSPGVLDSLSPPSSLPAASLEALHSIKE